MKRSEYLKLFEKYLAGNATEEEIVAIMGYDDEFEMANLTSGPSKTEEKARQRILSKIDSKIGNVVQLRRTFGLRWYVAAAVLIIITAGIIIMELQYNKTYNKEISDQFTTLNKKNDIPPGVEKAMLTLANGREIILTDSLKGTLVKQGNVLIKKEKNGVVHYIVTKSDHAVTDDLKGLNTFATPRGAEYHITLPDGTMVWLNASSSIKFPTTFAHNERNIELTGEAYFEVAKDKHKPFKIKFNNQVVEVIGTHFNIMAYADEPESRTTLLEGTVRIYRDQMRQTLLPGQQAVSGINGKGFKVQQANVQQVMAWKNGYFMFRNVSIDKIMRQAARWYDVDIFYEGDWMNKEYGGRISKYKNISELLHNLELTGTVRFKVEGRRVTVMQ